jgi:hypothetical protein
MDIFFTRSTFHEDLFVNFLVRFEAVGTKLAFLIKLVAVEAEGMAVGFGSLLAFLKLKLKGIRFTPCCIEFLRTHLVVPIVGAVLTGRFS